MRYEIIGPTPSVHERAAIPLRLVAVAIVEDDRGRILLGKMPKDRGFYPGQWAVLGGGVEPGETSAEAAIRETREECGLTVEVTDTLPHAEAFGTKHKPGHLPERLHCVFLYHVCRVTGGNLTPNEEFEDMRFFTREEIASLDLNEGTKHAFSMLWQEIGK